MVGDSKRPDAITDTLVPYRTVAIEIAATNDNAISGEEAIDAIALQVSAAAEPMANGFYQVEAQVAEMA